MRVAILVADGFTDSGLSVALDVFRTANTLARRALNELNIEGAAEYMSGPTAWAFSNDPVAPAKILKDFAKKSPKVVMVGGVLNGKAVSGEQLKALASLPSRDQLLAQVVGTIAAPLPRHPWHSAPTRGAGRHPPDPAASCADDRPLRARSRSRAAACAR